MNIQGDLQRLHQILGISQSTNETEKAQPVQTSSEERVSSSDQANLSTVASIASLAAGGEDVRFDKVAATQAAIAGGDYRVEASDVASKMIEHMLGTEK